MAQETHYYNNVIAQLVELRKDMTAQGESSSESLDKKFDEVIDAIKKIQVTADNIKVDAGTINLSTDEVESLLRTVNTNLGIINDNLDEFDTNIQTALTDFSTDVKTEFSNLSTFLTSTLTTLTTNIGNNNTVLISKLESNRIDLNTNMETNTDSIIDAVTTNTTTLKKVTEDEVRSFKDANHTDLDTINTTLETINTNIDTEITALKTNDNTNQAVLVEKLNKVIDIFGEIHPVYGGPDVPILEALLGYLECTDMSSFRQITIGAQLSAFDMHFMGFTDIASSHLMSIDGATNNVLPKLDSIIAAINNNFGGVGDTPPVEGSMAAILTDILATLSDGDDMTPSQTVAQFARKITTELDVITNKLYGNVDIGTVTEHTVSVGQLVADMLNDNNGYYNMRTSQLNEHHTALINKLTSLNNSDNTNTQAIVDAINAIKVTADSIKIDAGTINLSTDEVEGLLKSSNDKADAIVNKLELKFSSLETKFDTLLTKMDTLINAVNNITNNGTHSIVMIQN